jgi:CheY-like chemotaxis protein
LILLDISMPEMNGFEVCAQLKSNPRLSSIPVIFLSALSDTQDKVKAFHAGGLDYVTKPFQLEEVQARVETHLQIHRLQSALQLHTNHLEELVLSRTRELAEAHHRLQILDRTKSDFLNLISHEFRTPLNGLFGVGDLLLAQLGNDEEGNEMRQLFALSRTRILTILEDALLLTQIEVEEEKFTSHPISLVSVLRSAITEVNELSWPGQITLAVLPAELRQCLILGTEELMVKALRALLEVSLKFLGTTSNIHVSCEVCSGDPRILIENHSATMPSAAASKFFDIFSISEAVTRHGDIGLGPALAYRILSLFGASVTLEIHEPTGIKITVSFNRTVQQPSENPGLTSGPYLPANVSDAQREMANN